jgi:hypothetical protein
LSFKIDDVDLAARAIEHNHFFFVHLPENVNNLVVGPFKEDFSLGIKVHETFLLAGFVHSDHNKSVVKGCGEGVHLENGLLKLDYYLLLQQHIYKDNYVGKYK